MKMIGVLWGTRRRRRWHSAAADERRARALLRPEPSIVVWPGGRRLPESAFLRVHEDDGRG